MTEGEKYFLNIKTHKRLRDASPEKVSGLMHSILLALISLKKDNYRQFKNSKGDNDIVRFQRSGSCDWVEGKVISRAGKKSGKYNKWWNVKNTDTFYFLY